MIAPRELRDGARQFAEHGGQLKPLLRLAEHGFATAREVFGLSVSNELPDPLAPGAVLDVAMGGQLSALRATLEMYSTYPGLGRVAERRIARLATTVTALANDYARLLVLGPATAQNRIERVELWDRCLVTAFAVADELALQEGEHNAIESALDWAASATAACMCAYQADSQDQSEADKFAEALGAGLFFWTTTDTGGPEWGFTDASSAGRWFTEYVGSRGQPGAAGLTCTLHCFEGRSGPVGLPLRTQTVQLSSGTNHVGSIAVGVVFSDESELVFEDDQGITAQFDGPPSFGGQHPTDDVPLSQVVSLEPAAAPSQVDVDELSMRLEPLLAQARRLVDEGAFDDDVPVRDQVERDVRFLHDEAFNSTRDDDWLGPFLGNLIARLERRVVDALDIDAADRQLLDTMIAATAAVDAAAPTRAVDDLVDRLDARDPDWLAGQDAFNAYASANGLAGAPSRYVVAAALHWIARDGDTHAAAAGAATLATPVGGGIGLVSAAVAGTSISASAGIGAIVGGIVGIALAWFACNWQRGVEP